MRRWLALAVSFTLALSAQAQDATTSDELVAQCPHSATRLRGLGGLLVDQVQGQPPPRHYDSRVHPYEADAVALALPPLAFFPQDESDVLLLGDKGGLIPAFDPQMTGPLWWAIVRDERIIAQGTCANAACEDAPRLSAAELGAPGDALRLLGGAGRPGAGCTWAYDALAIRQESDSVRLLPPAIEPLWTPPRLSQRPPLWGWIMPLSPVCGQVIRVGEIIPLRAYAVPLTAKSLRAWLSAPDGMVASLNIGSDSVWRFEQAGLWRIHWLAELPTLSPSERLQLSMLGAADGCTLFVLDDEPLSGPSTDGPLRQPQPLSADVPPGWTETRALISVRAPFGLLEEIDLKVPGRQARYIYDARALGRLWPQLDDQDEVRVTLALRGRDADGAPRLRVLLWIIQNSQVRQVQP
ncbi:MAG: hypothetical protein NZ750_14190 [Anaerolineae bacterium]|nr:hypothetical protein [Anaerolineae bacterium]MDW8173752.1 hypothetical protein [Anaerolineae bacterium]